MGKSLIFLVYQKYKAITVFSTELDLIQGLNLWVGGMCGLE